MNGRIARKQSLARKQYVWWFWPSRDDRRKRANLRRMNRKTRQACQRLANDLGGAA